MIIRSFRLLAIVSGLACVAAAQIVQGSFETGVAGSTTMPTPWVASAVASNRIMPFSSCVDPVAVGFPTNGTKWLRVGTASVTGTPANFATSSNVSQVFSTGTGGTVFSAELAFMTGETVGSLTSNDFATVTITSGASTQTIWSMNTATGVFPNTACSGSNSRPESARINLSVDLFTLFPGMTPTTSFTVKFWVVNNGNTFNQSYLYVDNVRLTVGSAQPSSGVFPNGGGNWTVSTTATTLPFAEAYHLAAFARSTPTGSGPLFGIELDSAVLGEATAALGTDPYHVQLDGTGHYNFGPFAIPTGIQVDYVCILVANGGVAWYTAAQTYTF